MRRGHECNIRTTSSLACETGRPTSNRSSRSRQRGCAVGRIVRVKASGSDDRCDCKPGYNQTETCSREKVSSSKKFLGRDDESRSGLRADTSGERR